MKRPSFALALSAAALALGGCAGGGAPKTPDLAAVESEGARMSNALALTLTTLSALHDEAQVKDGAARMGSCPEGDGACRRAAGDKAVEAARPRGAALKGAVEAQHALKEALETRATCRAAGDDACVLEQAALVAQRLPELERLVAGLKGLVTP